MGNEQPNGWATKWLVGTLWTVVFFILATTAKYVVANDRLRVDGDEKISVKIEEKIKEIRKEIKEEIKEVKGELKEIRIDQKESRVEQKTISIQMAEVLTILKQND